MGIERFRYDGKRAVVTGGASGMGEATGKLLNDLGAEVIVLDIQDVPYPVAQSIRCDLRDQEQIDAALEVIGAPIHAVFSCAGVSGAPSSPVEVMLVNFIGARHFIDRATESLMPDGSAVAIISSIGGLGWEDKASQLMDLVTTPDFASAQAWVEANANGAADDAAAAAANYVLSKQAHNVYVQYRAAELCHQGIRINAIGPGPTATPLAASTPGWTRFGQTVFRDAMKREMLTAEDQAYPLVFLNSDAAGAVSGQLVNVDSGFTAACFTGVIPAPMDIFRSRV